MRDAMTDTAKGQCPCCTAPPRRAARSAKHEKGSDTYTHTYRFQLYRHEENRSERTGQALTDLGLEWASNTRRAKRKGHRVYYVEEAVFAITVPREFEGINSVSVGRRTGFSVPSWDDLHQDYIQRLQRLLEGLQDQHKAIVGTCTHHRNNPSKGVKVAKKGPTVHHEYVSVRDALYCKPGLTEAQRTRRGISCGSRAYSIAKTKDVSQVTCKRCRKALVKKGLLQAA